MINPEDPELEKNIRQVVNLIKNGRSYDRASAELGLDPKIGEIAQARIKGRNKFSKSNKMFFGIEDLRFATSEIVAKYRAKRLGTRKMVDLCSGIGSQTIQFSFSCTDAVGIDKDPEKVKFAEANAKVYDSKARFIVGDVLGPEIQNEASDCDILFCDPSRAANSDKRKLDDSIPAVNKLLDQFGSEKIAIEVPPQISYKNIPYECEKEYLSVKSNINRLTLYFGSLMNAACSAVSIDSGESFAGEPAKLTIPKGNPGDAIYHCDEALARSGLIQPYLDQMKVRYPVLVTDNWVSAEDIRPGFFQRFDVIGKAESASEARQMLQNNHAGKIFLRGTIKGDYYKLKSEISSGFKGDKEYHLLFADKAIFILSKQERL